MRNRKSQTNAASEEAKGSPAESMSTFAKLANLLFILVLTTIAFYIIFRTVSSAGIILYTFHPVFMAIGYLILMTHAILLMADKNIFTQGYSYQKRVTTHWVLQASALALITIAQTSVYIFKENNGYPHYASTHSLFGLVTYILTFGATVGGVLTKYSSKMRSFIKPVMLKVGHGFAGITVYTLSIATIFLGLNQSWADYNDIYRKFGILFAFILCGLYVVSISFRRTLSLASGLSKK